MNYFLNKTAVGLNDKSTPFLQYLKFTELRLFHHLIPIQSSLLVVLSIKLDHLLIY